MSAANKLGPELRFPEFQGDGDWVEWTLGDKATIKKGKGVSKTEVVAEGQLKCIRYGELYTHYSEVITEVLSRTNTPANQLVLSKAGDVIIPASGETKIDIATASCVVSSGIAIGGDLNIIRSNVNGSFLSYYLNGPKKMDIAGCAQGVSVMHLYPNQLGKLQLATPSPAEQQKIADCLGSLDDLLAAHSRKLAALQDHKKGLLQQLFPSEGETTPKLRFPGFKGDWETTKAVRLFSNRIKKGKEGLPIYSVSQAEGLVKRSTLKRKVDDIADPSGNKAVCRGDLAYNMMRMWQGAVGVAGENCMVSPAYIVLKPSKAVTSDFYAYYFKTPNALQLLEGHSRGLTKDRLRLYYDDFGQISLPFPTRKEQQKIADCLSALDALITAQTEQIAALKEHKKGLMQKLFPNPELMKA